MGYIARKLTHLLNKYVPMTDDEFEVYQYAFDIALSSDCLLPGSIGMVRRMRVCPVFVVPMRYLSPNLCAAVDSVSGDSEDYGNRSCAIHSSTKMAAVNRNGRREEWIPLGY